MDAPDDHSSDPILDESQPSQLIKNVLQSGAIGGGWNINDANRNPSDLTTPKDTSLDSPATWDPNLAPRYHYHGLATTQSQSQPYDAFEDSQGSQKENIGTPNTSGETRQIAPPVNARHPSHTAPSLEIGNKETTPPGGQSGHPSLRATSKSRAMAPPAWPVPTTRVNESGRHIKATVFKDRACPPRPGPASTSYQQSVDDFSQDSFAGPISPDPEREFLAKSKKFDIPLTELANVSYSQESQDVPLTTGEIRHSLEDTEMFVLPGRRGLNQRTPPRPQPPPDHGRILAPATPSISGSSQSQNSQLETSFDPDMSANGQPMDAVDDDPIVDMDTDARSEPSSDENHSEPSSSYERLLAGEPEPVEDTPAGYEATQPSTQRDDMDDATQVDPESVLTGQKAEWGTDSHRQGPSDNPSAPSAASSVQPRSIMSMVDPRKPWRFTKHDAQLPAPAPTMTSATPLSANQDQTMDSATQPSFDSDDQESVRLSAGFRPQARHEIAWPVRKRQLPPSHDMEIIPDSEPMRIEQAPHPLPAVPPSSPPKNDTQETETTTSVPGSVIEEDEDDIPLSTLARKAGPIRSPSRGKGKAPVSTASKRRPLEMVTSSPVGKKKLPLSKSSWQPKLPLLLPVIETSPPAAADADIQDESQTAALACNVDHEPTDANLAPPGQSCDTSIVPSSIPEQDLCEPTPETSAPPKAAPKGKGKAKTAAKPAKVQAANRAANRKTKARSASKNLKKNRRVISPDLESGASGSSYDEADLLSASKGDDDEGTELADGDYSDPDSGDDVKPGSKKRKRMNTRGSSRKAPKIPAQKRTTRATKRSDTGLSSKKQQSPSTGTKVFALWKSDNHYYSGYVESHVADTKYHIKFDDGSEDNVDISRLRLNGLRNGDNVILVNDREKVKVFNVDRLETDATVVVELNDGDGTRRQTVPISDIMIATRTISAQWRDRMPTVQRIQPLFQARSLGNISSLSRSSVVSRESSKAARSRLLSKFGFAITLSPGIPDWEAEKNKLITTIKSHGGTVIDDWFSFIRMEGRFSHGQKRWTMQASDVTWQGRPPIERIFLVADDVCQKSKYLVALALGIPCLSTEWLYRFVDQDTESDTDWQPYLLPQGVSTPLEARVSQFVDLDWCNSPLHLENIMDNKVAAKVFKDKSILCLGEDFLPAKNADQSRAAWSAVPRVVIAMGAQEVEAAADKGFASRNLSRYDYVILKDSSEFERYESLTDNATLVTFQWVKECLIARQIVPISEGE